VFHAASPARALSASTVSGVRAASSSRACVQGLTLDHFSVQLEDLRDTSLTLELNLSTFGTHPRVNLDYSWDKVGLS
jgi:hypothetical protein